MLQASNLQIFAAIAEEVESNPILDIDPPAAGIGLAGTTPAADKQEMGSPEPTDEGRSLSSHLFLQLNEAVPETADQIIGGHLIAQLDEDGYLREDLDQIAESLGCDAQKVEDVYARLRRFDPPGVFARDLRDCLALQLADKNRLDPAMEALLDNMDLVAAGDRPALARRCRVDDDDLNTMLDELRALDPRPGRSFSSETSPAVVPDILVHQEPDGEWIVELNGDTLPRLIVNNAYRARLSDHGDHAITEFLDDCVQRANWLVKALHQRSDTILKVAADVVGHQRAFLDRGIGELRPLGLRDVAERIGVHESTVSRAVSNKYMATPRGTFAMKTFFSTAVRSASGEDRAAEAVRDRIKALIAAETPDDILSDERLAAALRNDGIDIARRTVAKYREQLGIAGSATRRRAARLNAR